MAGPTRRDTFRVTLQIRDPKGGEHNFGTWDKKSGGAIDTDVYKYKPGGMGTQVSLGGSKTIEDLTVSRLYRHQRDHLQLQNLINWTGRAKVTVSQHVLDIDGNEFASPIVWVGILKTTTPPDHDSESTDPAMIELVISPDGDPVAT